MTYTTEDVERLYSRKRNKYKSEGLTDELDEVIYKEALKEVACSAFLNGGRKIRR